MHTLKTSSKIIVFGALGIIGIGIFFIGKHVPTLENVRTIKNFIAEVPDTPPSYVGKILSKDGNLLTIEYFETEDVEAVQFENKQAFIKFLHESSLAEKLKVKDQLQQKIAGKTTVLVPLNAPIYKKEDTPVLSSFRALKRDDFVIIWGSPNEKGQIVSSFILTANENKNDIK